MKNLIKNIRANGTSFIADANNKRRLVYANMIWLATYSGYLFYQLCALLLVPNCVIPYLLNTLFINLLFLSYYYFIKKGHISFSKHWLLLSVYFIIALVDHQNQKTAFSYIYLFAFLPAAMNVFSLKNEKLWVYLYTLLPLFYMIFSRVINYNYAYSAPVFSSAAVKILTIINLVTGFTLFVTFGAYLIFNNMAKQQKLLVNSISLQATLDNSEAAIWSIDKKYTLTAVNIKYVKSVQKYFGNYEVKKGMNLKEQAFWDFFPVKIKQQYEDVLKGKNVLEEVEINNSFFEIKAVPVFNLEGELQGATFGSRDITNEKIFKEALINAKKSAEEASTAKARFINNMSHEIRTPLNGIIGIARILEDEKFLPHQLQHLRTLQDLSDHTVQIVNNILDFAKIEAGKAELDSKRFNLIRFTKKMYSLFKGTAQLKGIPLVFEQNGDLDIYLKGDEVRLSQVIINLLSNAFKFTEKGKITLTINTVILPQTSSYKIKFIVTDTGIGIMEQNVNKIFESFTQADAQTTRKFGGTGLGLSIAGKIVELMGSELRVESNFGKGTIFSFEVDLPKSSPDLKLVLPQVNYQLNAAGGLNILVAEDNKINQLVAKKMLEKWKNSVKVVSNGKEALEQATMNNYDIVLMDLDMPVMDGYEATELIKEKKPGIPVIALTAAAFDDMHNYLTKKGFSDVVQKPFVPDELYSKIFSLVKKAV